MPGKPRKIRALRLLLGGGEQARAFLPTSCGESLSEGLRAGFGGGGRCRSTASKPGHTKGPSGHGGAGLSANHLISHSHTKLN